MFRCGSCAEFSRPGEKSTTVVTQTRVVKHREGVSGPQIVKQMLCHSSCALVEVAALTFMGETVAAG